MRPCKADIDGDYNGDGGVKYLSIKDIFKERLCARSSTDTSPYKAALGWFSFSSALV